MCHLCQALGRDHEERWAKEAKGTKAAVTVAVTTFGTPRGASPARSGVGARLERGPGDQALVRFRTGPICHP